MLSGVASGNPSHLREFFKTCDGNPFEIAPLRSDDLPTINQILAKYEDQKTQLADACLIHLAGKLDTDRILTVDQHDFRIYRTPDGKPFRILSATAMPEATFHYPKRHKISSSKGTEVDNYRLPILASPRHVSQGEPRSAFSC